MPFVNDHRTPPQALMDNLHRKVNAGGKEPRVLIEFDKMVYVPGIKFKYETLEALYNSSVTSISTSVDAGTGLGGGTGNSELLQEMIKLGEPETYNASNPTSGARFEYIKCSLASHMADYCLPTVFYPFMLAVAWHETGFGTLGQGRPQNGSFIVGYGCPGACNMAYKGINTQSKFFAKRIKEAMKSRMNTIKTRGYLTADDIHYFHEGGDKGMGTWRWSADGANWKKRVKNYYDQIRGDMGGGELNPLSSSQNKWRCSSAGGIQTLQLKNSACPNQYTFASLSSNITDVDKEIEPITLAEALRPNEYETDVYYENDGEVIHIPRLESEDIAEEAEVSRSSTSGSEKMTYPLQGLTYATGLVTSHFGADNPGRRDHTGIDLVPRGKRCTGWVIVSAYDGEVEKTGSGKSSGNYVRIRHYNGLTTNYFHLADNSITVSKGDKVKAGQPIAKCGNTGHVIPMGGDGSHLHFEVFRGTYSSKYSSKLNPRPFLQGSQVAHASESTSTDSINTGHIVKNKVFDVCMSATSKKLPTSAFVGLGSGEYFAKYDEKTKQNVHVFGFKAGSVGNGDVDSISCKHKFSADGVFEAKVYVNLKESDQAYIRVDGKNYAVFTSENNGVTSIEPIYMTFINTGSTDDGQDTVATEHNEHVIDLYVVDNSGQAEIGYMCVTLSEVEGGAVSTSANYRRKIEWIEQGDVVFEKTILLEDDIKSWEVTSHFDRDSTTATITLDNTKRIYSPTYDYNGIAFPRNNIDTEFSYFDYGERKHIISEGTPIRIYAGYGDDLVRVFTGFITGEVQDDADNNTVTFECVDMYSLVENHIFITNTSYPETNLGDINTKVLQGETSKQQEMWVMSSIIHNIANKAGLSGWRIVEDDLKYPDIVIQETYYIDIDKGGKTAVVWDAKQKKYVQKTIQTVKTLEGYKNPYVMSIDFEQGTRASDAIHQLIGDTMFRAYCDRYGTFRLDHLVNMYNTEPKWEFIDNYNMTSLNTSVDYTRTRNHLMILGNQGHTEHFVDKELVIATKGKIRTAQVEVDWIDESYGASAFGQKKAVADRLFMDMKRQSRTFNIDVKGNPLIDVTDGCYIYSEDSSVQGYYLIKGHTLRGTAENMISSLELTWELNGYKGIE